MSGLSPGPVVVSKILIEKRRDRSTGQVSVRALFFIIIIKGPLFLCVGVSDCD
jgi:hypothetical protein